MISETTISEIKDRMDVAEVVGHFIPLKKAGANFTGLCPFHDEKTPSFHVTPAKGIFKCFGCGKAGDSITFLIEHEKLSYPEALKWLADFYKITIEETKDERKKEEIDEEEMMGKINRSAARKYHERLLDALETDPVVQQLLYVRQLSIETIIQWQIGFAPDEWRFLTATIVEKGLWDPASKLGIVKRANDTNYDFFRNRIMMPVADQRGNVVGFSGRLLEKKNDELASSLTPRNDEPKYLNSAESVLYHKDKILFGLWHAGKAIRENKFAYVVEGNFDVITLHDRGISNTVAPCGTAITSHQVKLLKKYASHAVLMMDGDKAGQASMIKNIDLFLEHEFKTEVCILDADEYPDSWARKFPLQNTIEESSYSM